MPKRLKIVKVRIRRGGPSEDMMVYPSRYDAQEVDRCGIGPLNLQRGAGAYSGHIGLGGDEEWCLIALPPDLAAEYAKDPDMEIVTVDEADALMEEWRKFRGEPEILINDPDRLRLIHLKIARGLQPSQEDLKALDPDDDTPGVVRRLWSLRRLAQKAGIQFE